MKFTFRILRLLAQQFRAIWKYFLSFRKREWVLEDYPLSLRIQSRKAAQDTAISTRWKLWPYTASLINWHAVSGFGDTGTEALDNLRKRFEEEKAKGNRPRPGTVAPIQFASQARVLRHQELADDLLKRIFEVEEAWISDESSLWDFCFDASLDEPLRKIGEIYNVDDSDITSGNLADILERIAAAKNAPTHP